MTIRSVEIRVTVDDRDATPKLDRLSKKLDEIAKKSPNIKIKIDDSAVAKLDKLALKLDDLSKKVVTPKVGVGGVDETLVKLDKVQAKLDKIARTKATARVNVNVNSGSVNKAAKTVVKDVTKDSGNWFSRLFGGGGGGGGAGGGAGAAGGGGKAFLSAIGGANNYLMGTGIATLIAWLGSMMPALVPTAIGGGIGGLGAFAALALGSRARTNITADQAAVAQALAALKGKSGNTPSNRLSLAQAQHTLKVAQANYGGFLPIGNDLGKIQHAGLGALLGALNQRGTTVHAFQGNNGPFTITHTPSFLQGLAGILSQISKFLKSIGPGLGEMFRASLPFLQLFVGGMEMLAKTLMPAFTQAMNAFKPDLPIMQQGFTFLAQGIADFVKDLGPGMKDGAIVFKASMDAIKGILIGLAYVFDATAIWLVKLGERSKQAAHDMRNWFDKARSWVSHSFDSMRHYVASVWDAMWNNTIGVFERFINRENTDMANWRHDIASGFDNLRHEAAAKWDDLWSNVKSIAKTAFSQETSAFDGWRHNIASTFDNIRHDTASAWNTIWSGTLNTTKTWGGRVIDWYKALPGNILNALKSLGKNLYSLGRSALTQLWKGFKSIGSSILGWAKSIGGGIVGAFKSAFGIASPSKPMWGIGVNLGHSLLGGLQSTIGHLQLGSTKIGGSVVGWISAALKATHKPMSWLPALERLVSAESGGDPRAYNPVSVGGQHAEGLFQTLPSTFSAYGVGGSIYNPIADAIAGIRYIASRYGSPFNIPGLFTGGYHGYYTGGWVNEPVLGVGMRSGSTYGFGEKGPEYVSPHGRGGGDTYNVFALDESYSDEQALRLIQKIRRYKQRHGKLPLGFD